MREFKAGDVIFRQGDDAKELFVIQRGSVEIRLGNRVLETLSDYAIFGEMALIDSAPRSAMAVAVSDVKLVSVGEKQFLFPDQPYAALRAQCLARHGAAAACIESLSMNRAAVTDDAVRGPAA